MNLVGISGLRKKPRKLTLSRFNPEVMPVATTLEQTALTPLITAEAKYFTFCTNLSIKPPRLLVGCETNKLSM